MPSGKVILTKSEPPMQRRKTKWKQTYRKIKDKSMKPIPEGCYTTVLYVQLNLLFCGLWELKYMPATLRWCPPLWHPTHPWDFLRFWARCRFKISPRVWSGQLLARSAGSLSVFTLLFQVAFHLPLHSSFPSLLSQTSWLIHYHIFVFHWSRLCSMASAHHRTCRVWDYTHGRRSTFLLLEVNAG